MWFNNIELDEEQFDELKDRGGIQTKSSPNLPASIQILTTNLDQTQSQTFVDYLYERMLTIAAVPDRNASAGGNTGQALVIGQGWTMAESAAKAMEHEFKSAEKRFLEYTLKILKETYPARFESLDISDIEIKFTRNKTDNLLTKTQGLQNQLEAGIHPRIAIANCGLYSDPEQVYTDSIPYLEKWLSNANETQDTAAAANSVNVDNEFQAIIARLGGGENGGKSDVK
jgi:hypothetical protein